MQRILSKEWPCHHGHKIIIRWMNTQSEITHQSAASRRIINDSSKPLPEFLDKFDLNEKELEARDKVFEAVKDSEEKKKILDDYELMLFAVREKIRLTVDWNATKKMTERERVVATAKRVGLEATYDK